MFSWDEMMEPRNLNNLDSWGQPFSCVPNRTIICEKYSDKLTTNYTNGNNNTRKIKFYRQN